MASIGEAVAVREQSRFILLAAVAPGVLLFAHLLPPSGPGLALRLAAAVVCILLLPGALVLRALAWPSSAAVAVAASFALSITIAALAIALVFVVGGSIVLALAIIAFVAVCAAVPAALRAGSKPVVRSERRALGVVLGLAVPFAGIVWWAGGTIAGDGLFHLARARKLAEFDSLSSLAVVGEFKDGGLHPGYAFPLWQAVDALVARVAGVDVADAFVYLPAIFVPLAFILAYGAGAAIFGSHLGGLVVLGIQVAHFGFYWGAGALAGTGFFEMTSQPQAASHLLLAASVVVLVFAFAAEGGRTLLVSLAAAGLCLTLVHSTYTAYVALVLGGFVVARAVFLRGWERLLTRAVVAVGTLLVPFALYALLLLPVVRRTAGWTPSANVRARAFDNYGDAFTAIGDWLILSPNAIARAGAVVVAGLLAVPLAGFAARRLWAAFVLGGSLAILVVLLVPPLFTGLSDAFSLSQARRLVQFLPVAFAVAGGCLFVSRLGAAGVAVMGAIGTALVLVYPGEFSYLYRDGGPSWTVAVALAGGLVALVAGAVRRPRGPDVSRWAAAAAVAFVIPVAVAGLSGLEASPPRTTLTTGLLTALRAEAAPGDVVFSDKRTAYEVAAFAPVYINASTQGHFAVTRENRPKARSRATWRFLHRRSMTDVRRRFILDRWQIDWILIDKEKPHPEDFLRQLQRVYEDGRFALYDARA